MTSCWREAAFKPQRYRLRVEVALGPDDVPSGAALAAALRQVAATCALAGDNQPGITPLRNIRDPAGQVVGHFEIVLSRKKRRGT